MRISDWSSDVCSSDLASGALAAAGAAAADVHVMRQRRGHAAHSVEHSQDLRRGCGRKHFQVAALDVQCYAGIGVERAQRGGDQGGVELAAGQFELHLDGYTLGWLPEIGRAVRTERGCTSV